MRFPGHPVKGVTDDTDAIQDLDKIFVVAVKVADRDDLLNARPLAGDVGRTGEPGNGRANEKQEEKSLPSFVPDSD
jgi:hypothetical protein